MIYDFENYKSFSGFKLLILARMFMGIRHRRALEFVGSRTLSSKIPKFWYLIVGIRRHWSESDQYSRIQADQIPASTTEIWQFLPNYSQTRPDSEKLARFRRNFSESGSDSQMLPDSVLRHWYFFVRTKCRKIFSKNSFFLKNNFIENILQ
jgi:hypothetical protein